MFVFGSAANKADDSNDVGGRGKASPSADAAPSFAFDATSLPAVTATPPTTKSEDATAAGGFKFNVPPSQDLAAAAAEGGEAGDTAPLFGGTFQSRQVLLGAGGKTETKHEEAIHRRRQQQSGAAAVCANCGKHGDGEGGVVKLKNCTACLLVKYCSVDCQKAHRKHHKKACRQRVAELKDEQLYGQGHQRPERDFCPICTLPIPLEDEPGGFKLCCSKRICAGCVLAAQRSGILDCPFCRTPLPATDADGLAMAQAREEKKDPEALHSLAQEHFYGKRWRQKDVQKAFELWTEAVELGCIEAIHNLGGLYYSGQVVQEDKARGIQLYEKAAMQGFVQSRNVLGRIEELAGNYNRAVKHLLISANMGYKESVEAIKRMFMKGVATKEQYAQALKGYQDAVEEMKSHERDVAKAHMKRTGWLK